MKTWQSEESKELVRAIVSLENNSEAKKFLRDLLTEAEIAEFSKRWKAAKMLAEQTPYSQIVAQTGLSTATVARISKWLAKGAGGYRMMLERMKSLPAAKSSRPHPEKTPHQDSSSTR